jgi:hypothetical protein
MFIPWAKEVYGEADWKLGSIPKLVKAPDTFATTWLQYNQLDTWATDCTIYASMWAVSDLTWKVRTLDERKDMHNQAIEEWLDPASGWWLNKAVDLIRRNSPNTSSLRVDIDSKDFRDVLELWYSVITWYKWNRQYTEDSDDNCIVETAEIWKSTYGHCIRMTMQKDNIYVVDNYFGRKTCNVYKHAVFKEQVANWIFFYNWYIYFETIPMPVNPLPVHIKATDNPKYYNQILAREKECWDLWDDWFRPIYVNYIDWEPDIIVNNMMNDLMLVRKWLWQLSPELIELLLKLTPEMIANIEKIMWNQHVADQLYVIGQKFND